MEKRIKLSDTQTAALERLAMNAAKAQSELTLYSSAIVDGEGVTGTVRGIEDGFLVLEVEDDG